MNIEPGDIKIISISLSKIKNDGGIRPLNLFPLLFSFSLYEDVEEPSCVLELTLVDGINVVQDYPVIGEEKIVITMITPGRENVYKKEFYVYSVDGTGTSPSGKSSIYTIKAVTPYHFFNSSVRIEKAYDDTIDNIVEDILISSTRQAGLPSVSNFSKEKTKGTQQIVIPIMNPLQAINFVKQKAVSVKYPSGGAYLFFENQYGYNFKTIEGLLEEGRETVKSKVFTYSPDLSSNKQTSQFSFRNILNYNHLSKFNSVEKITSGAFNVKTTGFDILTKNLRTDVFKLSEQMGNLLPADKTAKIPNSMAEVINQSNSSGKRIYIVRDSSKPESFLDMLGNKNAYATQFNQNVVRVLVHGDTYLTAGDVIKLELPEVSGTTERKSNDTLNTGNYLVTKLRHIVTSGEGGKFKHSIAMDCARMGYK